MSHLGSSLNSHVENQNYVPGSPFECHSEIVAVSRWVPEKIVTSHQIEEDLAKSGVELSIKELIGVRERRVSKDSLLGMSEKVGQKVIEDSGVSKDQIDYVIYCSISKDIVEPAMSAMISHRLGLLEATAFDVNNACLGFIDAMILADSLIQLKRARLVLIVAAEKPSVNWIRALENIKKNPSLLADLGAGLSLGDGAAAMIMGSRSRSRSIRLIAGHRKTFSQYSDLCVVKDSDQPMITDSKSLFLASFRHGSKCVDQLGEYMHWNIHDIHHVVPHQASLPLIEQAAIHLNIDISKFQVTMDRFGNMASAALPFSLSESMEQKKLIPGSRILLLGFGSGLGIGLLGLEVNS